MTADLEIVHLSDLHWDSSKPNDPKIVTDALVKDLAESRRSGLISPDFLVFSGDLVKAGESVVEFDAAFNALIAPALDALGLDFENLIISPGNHDLSRKSVRDAKFIDNGLRDTLQSVDEVNRFIDELNTGNQNNLLGVSRMKGYYDFVDSVVPDVTFKSPLLRVLNRKARGLSVGIACFDSAWRATGEADDVDRGHLLLGERNVDNAIAHLGQSDINLAVMHHPLDWLADFDEVAVSSRISANFDVLFCGHLHRSVPQTRTTAQGTAILSQTGSVYAGRQWFNGYQTVQLQITDETCSFVVRSYYDSPRRIFDEATNIASTGRVSFPFSAQKKSCESTIVESFLRDNRQRVRDNATEHMNMIGLDLISCADVKEAFVPPPLSMRINSEDETESVTSIGSTEEISVDDILRSTQDYLISGNREFGKTGLMHYLSVLSAEGVIDKPRIPVVLNVETLKAGEYELRKAISNYYGSLPRGFDLKKAIENGLFLFLADNYVSGGPGAEALTKQIEATPNSRWICVTRPRPGSITGEVEDPSAGKQMKAIRVGALPRRSIRTLTKRWSGVIGSSNDEVFDAVMKQLKADGLPRTGYMVTLILWAMKQEKELNRVNEAILLSNVADYLLDKADFTQSLRGKLDPRGKEITLEYLSEFLSARSGYATVDDTVEFLAGLFLSKRLPLIAYDVFGELVKCGILDRTDNIVRFKYKCFQEYFFALRIKSDSELFAKIVSAGQYSKYAREVEMLAGLRRQNADILRIILDDMERRAPEPFESISHGALGEVIDSSLGVEISRRQISELRKKRMTADQVDDLLDAADRRTTGRTQGKGAKRDRLESGGDNALILTEETPDRMNVPEFITASNVLAKVTKNSDFTDFADKAPAARAVLSSYAKLCALFRKEVTNIISEMGPDADQKTLSEEERRVLVYHLTKLLARIISDLLANMLSAPNTGPMMDEILTESDRPTIEKLFIVNILQAIRYPGWEKRWSDLLRESGQSGFVVESLIGRMRIIVNTQYLDDAEYGKLHKVIDAAEEVLGWSSREKDYVIADLRKVALTADLRDLA